jgi:hypothetical protein
MNKFHNSDNKQNAAGLCKFRITATRPDKHGGSEGISHFNYRTEHNSDMRIPLWELPQYGNQVFKVIG